VSLFQADVSPVKSELPHAREAKQKQRKFGNTVSCMRYRLWELAADAVRFTPAVCCQYVWIVERRNRARMAARVAMAHLLY
jgi:hypothetical protein